MKNEEETRQSELKPTLGLFGATAISVGATVGAGIFVVTGIAAGLAGSAVVISMLLAAVIALFTALSFAELTAWQPREGSIYEYAYQLISPFTGFLVGWMWILSNTFVGAAVSLGFANYFTAIFPALPANWIAAILCIFFTLLNFFGIRQSAILNNFLVAAKLLVLAFFVIFGLAYIKPENYVPFAPLDIGMLYGTCYIFFAYAGFARVAVVAEEVKDAKRNVPRAMLLSLVASAVIYMLVGLVAVGLVGAFMLSGSNSPLTEAIRATENTVAVYIVSAGGLLATASVLLTAILGVSRMVYSMARRNDIPQALSKLHSKYNTPHLSIWAVGILMALLVLFVDLSSVVAISTFALLFYYTMANVSALKLKVKNRLYPRFIPVLGVLTCVALSIFILLVSPQAWIIGAAGLTAGVIYYFARKRVWLKLLFLLPL